MCSSSLVFNEEMFVRMTNREIVLLSKYNNNDILQERVPHTSITGVCLIFESYYNFQSLKFEFLRNRILTVNCLRRDVATHIAQCPYYFMRNIYSFYCLT